MTQMTQTALTAVPFPAPFGTGVLRFFDPQKGQQRIQPEDLQAGLPVGSVFAMAGGDRAVQRTETSSADVVRGLFARIAAAAQLKQGRSMPELLAEAVVAGASVTPLATVAYFSEGAPDGTIELVEVCPQGSVPALVIIYVDGDQVHAQEPDFLRLVEGRLYRELGRSATTQEVLARVSREVRSGLPSCNSGVLIPLFLGLARVEAMFQDFSFLADPELAARTAGSETPRFPSDCDRCLFYGPFGEGDLWFCPASFGGGTFIHRFGPDGDYSSTSVMVARNNPALISAGAAGVLLARARQAASA